MTCQTALALSIWRRQSVEPAAREILGSDVVQIDHMGAYACRNVNNGVGSNRISAHSQAAALDFAGVRLRDGRRITVTRDWSGDAPEARFLKRIRDDACRIFGTTSAPTTTPSTTTTCIWRRPTPASVGRPSAPGATLCVGAD